MTVSFRIDQGDEFARWLKEGLATAAHAGVTSAAVRTLSHITNELLPAANPQPVDTGAYRAGWRVEVTEAGADVVNTLPYAAIIEFGARPENVKVGKAMILALKLWVLRKGFFGLDSKGKKKADTDGQAESTAWAIAVAMKKRGIFNRGEDKGLRIGEKAEAYAKGIIGEEIRGEIARRVR